MDVRCRRIIKKLAIRWNHNFLFLPFLHILTHILGQPQTSSLSLVFDHIYQGITRSLGDHVRDKEPLVGWTFGVSPGSGEIHGRSHQAHLSQHSQGSRREWEVQTYQT
jgi:hypothetical protein